MYRSWPTLQIFGEQLDLRKQLARPTAERTRDGGELPDPRAPLAAEEPVESHLAHPGRGGELVERNLLPPRPSPHLVREVAVHRIVVRWVKRVQQRFGRL
jgi:hypothetical protein